MHPAKPGCWGAQFWVAQVEGEQLKQKSMTRVHRLTGQLTFGFYSGNVETGL
jgi:hypothetical protein